METLNVKVELNHLGGFTLTVSNAALQGGA